MRLFAGPLFLALCLGCGANVVFEDPGDGGTTGEGATGQGATGQGASGLGGSIITGPAETPADCFPVCNHYQERGCDQPDCIQRCGSQYNVAGNCLDELATFTGCFASHASEASGCGFPPVCAAAYAAYIDCSGAKTGGEPSSCTAIVAGELPGASCTSYASCSGSLFSEACWGQGGKFGGFQCECAIDGVLIGTCSEVDEGSCDAASSCCEFVLPWPG